MLKPIYIALWFSGLTHLSLSYICEPTWLSFATWLIGLILVIGAWFSYK